jgi:hypothetical protein
MYVLTGGLEARLQMRCISLVMARYESEIMEWSESNLFKDGTNFYASNPAMYRSPETPTMFQYRAPNRENAREKVLVTVGANKRSPLGDCLCQLGEDFFSVFPVDASICNRDTVLEAW